jgi:uncharacterized OB-fold protein
MARLAVAQRLGALANDRACEDLRVPLTEADYLASRMIAEPLRLLDCVMRCDGGNAFLVTSTRLATKLGVDRIIHPIAYRERTNFDPRGENRDITASAFLEVGPQALRDAGMMTGDIESFHPYDDFLIAVILQLEQIGFCAPGGASSFILDRDVTFRGDFPINPGGGWRWSDIDRPARPRQWRRQLDRGGAPASRRGGPSPDEARIERARHWHRRHTVRAELGHEQRAGAGAEAMSGGRLPIKATTLTRPFWSATKERRFLLQYDPSVDRWQFYPRQLSLFSTTRLEWREANGTGRLAALTRCHVPGRGFAGAPPYYLAIVELDEGPRILARLAIGEGDLPKVGQRMRIVWGEKSGDGREYLFAPEN